jgi:Skp family chaperone for outer membrane proteins
VAAVIHFVSLGAILAAPPADIALIDCKRIFQRIPFRSNSLGELQSNKI